MIHWYFLNNFNFSLIWCWHACMHAGLWWSDLEGVECIGCAYQRWKLRFSEHYIVVHAVKNVMKWIAIEKQNCWLDRSSQTRWSRSASLNEMLYACLAGVRQLEVQGLQAAFESKRWICLFIDHAKSVCNDLSTGVSRWRDIACKMHEKMCSVLYNNCRWTDLGS